MGIDYKPKNYLQKTDTINILAVMVQFQQDKDTLTTGNGNFNLSVKYRKSVIYNSKTIEIDTIVDPPPHNRDYFLQHMVFLKNYFYKVSDGKVIVNFTIPDKIYTLPNQMRAYGSAANNDYTKLVNLVTDSWRHIDSASPEIDFSKFQSFFIFHAGTGRDVNLADIYGYDPTPYDLPSIFFNLKSLQKYLGVSFKGVPVDNGKFNITNTAILPENEYRQLSSISGENLLQLSINGIIVSSLASYLGLPDLFNTKTGGTAIGRFGLMDGQSIFSYNGLFPPEPNAWEKIYLGWIQPEVISSSNTNLPAYTHRTDGQNNSNYKVYKIPINSKEYFLVECKYRDPGKNGQKIKIWSNYNEMEYSFLKDKKGDFDQFGNVEAINGIVTDVEDYDWSLPYNTDDKDNDLNGGILIWHIDENVIDAKIASNNINDDPEHRGVDLEEADGSQDIGQTYSMTEPGYGKENGTAIDFWYNDLNLNGQSSVRPVYKNIFSPTSNPNSLAYDYSNSHISVYDFSAQDPVMTFKVKIGDESVQALPGYPKKINNGTVSGIHLSTCNLNADAFDELIFKMGNNLYCFNQNGKSITSDSSGKIISDVIDFTISDWNNNNNNQIICFQPYYGTEFPGACATFIYEYSQTSNTMVKLFTAFRRDIFDKSTRLINYLEDNISHILMYSSSNGLYDDIKYLSPGNLQKKSGNLWNSQDSVKSLVIIDKKNKDQFNRFAISDKFVKDSLGSTWDFSGVTDIKEAAGGDFDGDGISDCALLAYNKSVSELLLLLFNKKSSGYSTKKLLDNICANCWNNISNPSAGDIDGDGRQDIVFTFSDKIYAFNYNGILLPRFPMSISESVPLIRPLIGDIDGDKKNDIISISKDGRISAFKRDGLQVSGFPLTIGSSPAYTPVLFKSGDNMGLAVISIDGYLYAWKLKGVYDKNYLPWASEYANFRKTSQGNEILSEIFLGDELLPKSQAYNWPNPVYGKSTKIRFYLNENADVNIKILDISGEKVDELNGAGIGGIDNEIEWNVKNIQSGVYLGRIEAKSYGKSSVAIIKIAIVK